jgi:peptide chain release factor 1
MALKKLEKMRKRFGELDADLYSPESQSSPDFPKRLREHGMLSKIVPVYENYLKVEQEIADAKELIAGQDREMAGLAAEELPELENNYKELFARIKRLIATEDGQSDRDVIMEIRAATGGTEAGLFASDLFKMYRKFCDRHNLKVEVLDENRGEKESLRELTMLIKGRGAWGLFRYEGGGHRVQRVPETEAQGRVHTSLATVAVLPKVDPVEVNIDPSDLEISVAHAGGPGGQGVNTTDSAVRMLHKPSGLQVRCQESRSQRQNRETALEILRAKLFQLEQDKRQSEMRNTRLTQIGSGERSQRIRTYNFPQNRCTDHRLEGDDKNWSLERVVNGEIDDILNALNDLAATSIDEDL